MRRQPTRLKLAIVQKGILQADLARDAGLTESRLSRLVNGRAAPREYELKNLSSALGVEREVIR